MQNIDLQIYTIGHGSRNINLFLDLLVSNEIKLLIDVRSIPYSRFHSQFRQKTLKDSLQAIGIDYLWLGKELGGRPEEASLYLNGKADYFAMKETELFQSGLLQVVNLVKQGIKVTLMCSEGDQNHCHRKHLISDELVKFGITVLHINKSGVIEQQVKVNNYSLFID